MKNNIGLYGLGVMGVSLARNVASKGFSISVCNRNVEVTKRVCKEHPELSGFLDVKEFIDSLETPRKIMLMVTAGNVVDKVIETFLPMLDQGDILIDCGNTFFEDTQRRIKGLQDQGIHFIGCGVSGGEQGALLGPSMMPSGNIEAYQKVQKIFEAIAAQNDDGSSCCTYIGKGGSGHFVKMVHNGIEYAEMQLIAEAYTLIKNCCESQTELENIWHKLKEGKLKSYLMDITYDIIRHKENNEYLLPYISDIARQKGTGKWTSQISFDYGVAIPCLTEAVQVRFMSTEKTLREQLSKFAHTNVKADTAVLQTIEDALYLARISIYAQGLHLIDTVSKACDYQINMKEIARIWQNGCIIKSQFLKEIILAYKENPNLSHLMLSSVFAESITKCDDALRAINSYAMQNHIYVPIFSSSMQYIDGICTNNMCTNMIQAQRDYFGAHTYERIDQEGTFHTEW